MSTIYKITIGVFDLTLMNIDIHPQIGIQIAT